MGQVARGWGFDVLLVVLAVAAVLAVALRRDDADAPQTTLWFCVPAAAVIVLGLLSRQRFPFGVLAAFLLGNLRDVVLGRVGLAVILGSMATIILNQPGHSAGELVFIPLLFG